MYKFKKIGQLPPFKCISQSSFTRRETREFYWRNFELVHLKVYQLLWPDHVKTEDDLAAYLEKQARTALNTELPDRYYDNEHKSTIRNIQAWGNGFLDNVSFLQLAVTINYKQGDNLLQTKRDVKADNLDSELTEPAFTLA